MINVRLTSKSRRIGSVEPGIWVKTWKMGVF